jgi:hypothetical protein
MDSMICLLMVPSGPSGVRQVRISVPRIDCLLDGQRYWLPDTLPPPAGEELRPLHRPRIGPQWTSHDHREARRRREQRDLAELARMLGDPV